MAVAHRVMFREVGWRMAVSVLANTWRLRVIYIQRVGASIYVDNGLRD